MAKPDGLAHLDTTQWCGFAESGSPNTLSNAQVKTTV
jgi:hypothetical protein